MVITKEETEIKHRERELQETHRRPRNRRPSKICPSIRV